MQSIVLFGLLSACISQEVPAPEKLWDAAYKGDLQQVTELIEAKADLEKRNDYGRTALSLAAGRGHENVMRALISAGADIETKDRFYKFTPLTTAVLGKQAGAVRVLIEAKAKGAGSALMFVAGTTETKVVEALLAAEDLTYKQVNQALTAAKTAKQEANVALLEPVAKRLKEAMPEDAKETPESSEPPKLSAEQLSAFAGTYDGPRGMSVKVKAAKDHLDIEFEGSEQAMSFTPSAKDEFAMKAANLMVKFNRTEDKVSGFKWTGPGSAMEFKRSKNKTDTPDEPKGEPDDPTKWTDYEFDPANWPAFRGTLSRGYSDAQNLPSEWDVKSGKNIAWKIRVPGLGLSCPTVWGDNVFITTAIPADSDGNGGELRTGLYGDVDSVKDDRDYEFRLYCFSLESGAIKWQQACYTGKPRVKRHSKSSHANPTPVTNGDFVVASFSSEGVYCFDMSGKQVWKKDLGFLDSGWFFDREYQWGFASSPMIDGDVVYLQCDIQDQSFLGAYDLKSGDEKWRTDRDDIPTWGSPVAYADPDGKRRVVVNGTRQAAAYDAESGKQLWTLGGMSEIVVPTPQVTNKYVLLASGYSPIRPILAVRHDASGELNFKEQSGDPDAKNGFAWKLTRGGSYLPTPVVYRGYVFVCGNNGVLTCYSAASGKQLSRLRLRGKGARSFTGSPVASDGKLFITAEQGQTFVVPAEPKAKVESVNELGESVLTSAAIAGNTLLVRGDKHLFAISKRPEPKEPEELIIVAGQSNAVGFDAKPGQLTESDIDAKIPFWWRCGDPPPDTHDTMSKGWTTLKPQSLGNPIKPRKGRQYGNYAQKEGGFGPEIGFARAYYEAGNTNFSIVKAAFSGTGIARDWTPDTNAKNGSCYRALLTETRRAIAAARRDGRTLGVKAIIWVQGESDANAKDAPQYAERLKTMMNWLRRDLDAPEMQALVAVNTKFGGANNKFMPTIVEQQELAAKEDEKCFYVDTSTAPIANNAHYDTEGTILVGELFAKALLKAQTAEEKQATGQP